MTGLIQSINDLKLILSTDKRFWAAGGFVFTAIFVWFATTTWRNHAKETPDEFKYIKVKEVKVDVLIDEFNQAMKEGKEERGLLKDYIYRVHNDLNTSKQDMDWQMSSLVQKLDHITENVDVLANKVGASSINNAKVEQRLKLTQKRDTRKKKHSVDYSLIR
jgi:hypothetical protein